jgi:DNA-binding MarR family transcriptional regulator
MQRLESHRSDRARRSLRERFPGLPDGELELHSDLLAESLRPLQHAHFRSSDAPALEAGENPRKMAQNMKKMRRRKSGEDGQEGFPQLATYRLHQLSTLSERLIGTRYRQRFGLRMVEVGILIMVGGSGPLSFKSTYTNASLEKSNASRLAAHLLEKGLLEKRVDPADQRSFYLALTAAGEKLYRELYADAVARNRKWIAVLPRKQRATFLRSLDLLTQNTQKLLEQLGANGGAHAFADRVGETRDLEPPQRIVLDSAAASQLYALLGTALGKEQSR